MAIQVHISNSLQHLANAMFSKIQNSNLPVFKPNYIVTQTDGMNNWLKLQMATTLGIAANCHYIKPNDAVNKFYQLLGGKFDETLNPQHLHWLLYSLLAAEDFVTKHNNIANYYNTASIEKDVKRIALAEKMADLFDQYQIYRTDVILNWNNNNNQKNNIHKWQEDLWKGAKKLAGSSFPDKTDVASYIFKACQNDENTKQLQQKLPTIYMFGISVISQYHVEILHAVGQFIDIHFFILNPSPAIYWYDDKSEKQISFLKKIKKVESNASSQGNPLLTSWGKIIQDTFNLLFKNDDILNNLNELEINSPTPNTLLHTIQVNITNNDTAIDGEKINNAKLNDGTITINSCYTAAREVEVLYNFLVNLVVKNNNELASQDILVMVTDVNKYASYIKAVFDAAPYKFKYHIADQSFVEEDTLTNNLLRILQINEQNFTAENVVQLLECKYIKKQFNITNIDQIRQVVQAANIRAGIDGNMEDESVYISWQYGLKRIMYGLCISNQIEVGNDAYSFYPIDVAEGANTNQIIEFVYFVEQLIKTVQQRKQTKTLLQWVQYIDDIIHNFIFEKDEIADDDYVQLMNQLANYNTVGNLVQEQILFDVFMHSFEKSLENTVNKKSFYIGGITFCSLIPMRSIPFKIVAMLGLDYDKFPRKENPLSFSIMQTEKRKGDRNVKENDKHLFLETILSAKEYLYISYVGMSVKDNSHIPASTLVDEFLNYIKSIANSPSDVTKQLVTQHPLHSYSKQYNSGNSKLYSYTILIESEPLQLLQNSSTSIIENNVIGINYFINCLKNPIKMYYNSVLGIYYRDEEVTLQETELFELDQLQQFTLKDILLKSTDENEIKVLEKELVKKGILPLKNMAAVSLQQVETEVFPIKKMYQELVKNYAEQQIDVQITIDSITIQGTIGNIYNNILIGSSFSKSNETKNIFVTYIQYLLLCANGNFIEAQFISTKNKKIYKAKAVTKKDAFDRVKKLLLLYIKALQKISVFDIGFFKEINELESFREEDYYKILKDFFNNYLFPNTNAYLQAEYDKGLFNTNEAFNECKQMAIEILAPLKTIFPEYYA